MLTDQAGAENGSRAPLANLDVCMLGAGLAICRSDRPFEQAQCLAKIITSLAILLNLFAPLQDGHGRAYLADLPMVGCWAH